MLGHKTARKNMLEKLKQTTQNRSYTFYGWKWATMPQLGEAPLLRMGELWLNGRMDEREGEWIERKMVSRHSHGKPNDREWSVLRVTPTHPFILFLNIFRVLSPWLGL